MGWIRAPLCQFWATFSSPHHQGGNRGISDLVSQLQSCYQPWEAAVGSVGERHDKNALEKKSFRKFAREMMFILELDEDFRRWCLLLLSLVLAAIWIESSGRHRWLWSVFVRTLPPGSETRAEDVPGVQRHVRSEKGDQVYLREMQKRGWAALPL